MPLSIDARNSGVNSDSTAEAGAGVGVGASATTGCAENNISTKIEERRSKARRPVMVPPASFSIFDLRTSLFIRFLQCTIVPFDPNAITLQEALADSLDDLFTLT
jgi:hypothetical protein